MYARIKCYCSIKTSLLSAKCRIAPAIPQTLPRLELLSCLLLARLVADVLNAIKRGGTSYRVVLSYTVRSMVVLTN